MAQQTLNAESAATFRRKLNENFTELYNDKAIVNHASTTMNYGVASSSLFGHIKVTAGNGLTITNGVLALAAASTSAAGTVQLVDNATTSDATKAATARALKVVSDAAIQTYYGTSDPSSSTGKNGDIYFKLV